MRRPQGVRIGCKAQISEVVGGVNLRASHQIDRLYEATEEGKIKTVELRGCRAGKIEVKGAWNDNSDADTSRIDQLSRMLEYW